MFPLNNLPFLDLQVKHGYSKRVWCMLIGKTLYYFRSQEDKVCFLFLGYTFYSYSFAVTD